MSSLIKAWNQHDEEMCDRVSSLESYLKELEQEFLRIATAAAYLGSQHQEGVMKSKKEIIPKITLLHTHTIPDDASKPEAAWRREAIFKARALLEDLGKLREIHAEAAQRDDPAAGWVQKEALMSEAGEAHLAQLAEKDAEIAALKAACRARLSEQEARAEAQRARLLEQLESLRASVHRRGEEQQTAVGAMHRQVDAVQQELAARMDEGDAALVRLQEEHRQAMAREQGRADRLLWRLECGLRELWKRLRARSAETQTALERAEAEVDGARRESAERAAAAAAALSSMAESHWAHVLGLLAARSDMDAVRRRAEARLLELERVAAAQREAFDAAVEEERRAAAEEVAAERMICEERLRAMAATRDAEAEALRSEVARLAADGVWLVELARARGAESVTTSPIRRRDTEQFIRALRPHRSG